MHRPRGLAAPLALAALALGLPAGTASGATLEPTLLQQLDATTQGSSPESGVNAGALSYFSASDVEHGRELWRTDGTAAGTKLVKDLTPGTESSSFRPQMVALDSVAYVAAVQGDGTAAVWRTDGTDAGTTKVLAAPNGSIVSLAVAGTTVYASTDDEAAGTTSLWVTDGTGVMTEVKQFSGAPARITATGTGNQVLFSADGDGSTGAELWKSDGTAAGTVLVKDVRTGAAGSQPDLITPVGGGKIAFAARGGVGWGNDQLWVTDGTDAGTKLVRSFPGGMDDGLISELAVAGGTLVFSASTQSTGTELWRADLTTPGATIIQDLNPGSGNATPNELHAIGTKVYFNAGGPDGSQLRRTDGTTIETLPIGTGNANVGIVGANGGRVFMTADDGVHGQELWTVEAGGEPKLAKDVTPGGDGTGAMFGTFIPGPGGTGIVAVNDGVHGYEPWISDGTAAGTTLLADVDAAKSDTELRHPVVAGGKVFYTAAEPATGRELYVTDGSPGGSKLVEDITSGPADANISNVTAAGSVVYFVAYRDGAAELWRSDGTAAGTELVVTPSAYPAILAVGSDVYFTDGAKVQKVGAGGAITTVATTSSQNELSLLGSVSGKLYFRAATATQGVELHVTDGTEAGTHVIDVAPGADGSYPQDLVAVGDKGYFSARTPTTGQELHVTDGSTATLVADINREPVQDDAAGDDDVPPPTGGAGIDELTVAGGTLYFRADDGVHGGELWKLNAEGTPELVKDIRTTGGNGSEPRELIAAGGKVFFTGRDDERENRVYGSDGTAAGTHALAPEHDYYDDRNRLAFGGRLYFYAKDDDHGGELWSSDGTPSGTGLAADLVAGPAGSSPITLGALGDTLVASVYAPIPGRTIVALRAPAVQQPGTGGGGANPGGGGTDPGTNPGGGGTDPITNPDGGTGGTGGGTTTPGGTTTTPGGTTTTPGGTTTTPGGTTTKPGGATTPGGGKTGATTGGGKGNGIDTPYSGPPRPAPASLTLVKPARVQRDAALPYRYVFTGKLGVPKGTSRKLACAGRVVATVKRADKTITTAEGRVQADCTYEVVVKITSAQGLSRNGGKLDVSLRFAGNSVLRPMSAGATTVRYGD